MKNTRIRWNLSQVDIGHLSKTLKPIRSYREVGSLLGLSATLVCQLEASALRKVVHAMSSLETQPEEKP